jgi:endonuclease YncB( thermonuclease family)
MAKGLLAVAAIVTWQRSGGVESSSQIEVIDGDTVRFNGERYRLRSLIWISVDRRT